MDRFVVDKSRCIRHVATGYVVYPARAVKEPNNWNLFCHWVTLPEHYSEKISERIQALLSMIKAQRTSATEVFAVHADDSSQLWNNSTMWPPVCAVFESVALPRLRSVILRNQRLDENIIISWIQSLTWSIRNLHCHNIAHGDIHSLTLRVINDQILLPPIPILVGNGRCQDIHQDYCSPEHLLSDHNCKYDKASDIWSIACCIMEIYSGQSMFYGVDAGQILQRQRYFLKHLGTNSSVFIVDRVSELSEEIDRHLFSLLKSILDSTMENRPSISAIIEDPYFSIDTHTDSSSYIRIHSPPSAIISTIPVTCGQSNAWWRQSILQTSEGNVLPLSSPGQFEGLPFIEPKPGPVFDPSLSGITPDTLSINIDHWCNCCLNSATPGKVVVRIQFGSQVYTSSLLDYPVRYLDINHKFMFNHSALIDLCRNSVMVIRLIGIRDLPASVEQESFSIGSCNVDLSGLLTGFSFIQGYYQFDPSNVGQMSIKVQPSCSLDQRLPSCPSFESDPDHSLWSLFTSFVLTP